MADETYKNIAKNYDEKQNAKDHRQYILGDISMYQREENGSVEEVTVKTGGAVSDYWTSHVIASTNWKPKKVGFYIDGATGYAEFANVYISGAITIGSANIAGAIIKTSEGTQRVELNGVTNSLNYYYDDILRISLGSIGTESEYTSLNFYDFLGVLEGSIYGTQEGLALSSGAHGVGIFSVGSIAIGQDSVSGIGGDGIYSIYGGNLDLGYIDGATGLVFTPLIRIKPEEDRIYLGAVLHMATGTSGGTGIEADVFYNTTLHKLQVRTAAGWETVTSA